MATFQPSFIPPARGVGRGSGLYDILINQPLFARRFGYAADALSFLRTQTLYKRLRRAAAWIAAISACALSAFALEPPPVFLSAANFPGWRDSAHLLVVTNYTSSGVKITLYIEKPPPQDVYWTLHLDLYDGTNLVGQLEVGDKILDAWVLELTGAKLMGVKAVQSFTLSVSSNSLPQSTLKFVQRKRLPRNAFEAGNVNAVAIVPLRDVVSGATGGFRKGEPIFRRQQ